MLKRGEANDAVKDLLGSICLRRSKKALDLPNRTDHIHKIEFNMGEAAAYNDAKKSVIRSLQWTVDSADVGAYSNILARINALRQICNLGTHYQSQVFERQNTRERLTQDLFESMVSVGAARCSKCNDNLSVGDDEWGLEHQLRPRVFDCGWMLCASCFALAEAIVEPELTVCEHRPACDFRAVHVTTEPGRLPLSSTKPLPAKMRALQKDLVAIPEEEKRWVYPPLASSNLTNL